MIGLLILATSLGASWVPAVPDMITADICLSAMDSTHTSFSQELFDKAVARYTLSRVEIQGEQIYCEEYVRTTRSMIHVARQEK